MNKNILIVLIVAILSVTTTASAVTNTYTPSQILSAITPYMIPAYAVNPNSPLVQTQDMSGQVYIYKLPTSSAVFVFTSSGAIDCDGGSTAICKADTQGQSDTSLHTSNGQPIDQAFVPGYVLPMTQNSIFDYAQKNIQPGQSGMIIYNNSMTTAIFSDERGLDHNGGADIGEMTYGACMALGLDVATCDPNTGGISNGVTYIVFTGSSNMPSPVESISAEKINGTNALNVMMTQLNGTQLNGTVSLTVPTIVISTVIPTVTPTATPTVIPTVTSTAVPMVTPSVTVVSTSDSTSKSTALVPYNQHRHYKHHIYGGSRS